MMPAPHHSMNPQDQRPDNSNPGGMGGSTRMHDPSETGHDRVRRRLMNLAFLAIVALHVVQWHWIGVSGWVWVNVLLLAAAGAPLGLTVKLFELRFKMSAEERRRALDDLPARRKFELAGFALVLMAALVLNSLHMTWTLWGMWFYDFVSYYHDRPRRMRRIYAVTMILDELRAFPCPWLWPAPAVMVAAIQLWMG
jgi:hypothetical protein